MVPHPEIRARDFYGEYYGHPVKDLQLLLKDLRKQVENLIWTAGDSSLDNKYWFSDRFPAVDGAYANLLDPPQSKADVTYWLNHLLAAERSPDGTTSDQIGNDTSNPEGKWAAINTAVEATTLNERSRQLLPQDRFLRDNIKSNDVLVVSVGGNDVALAPTPCTILNMLALMYCLPTYSIEHGCTCATVPCDDYCCGCTSSCLSSACACPPCLGYFRHLFVTRLQLYLEKLCAKTKPAAILVCMIYYPEETPGYGWADPALGALGYNCNPAKLQAFIRKVYEEISSNISIEGTRIVPVPLFDALDSKNSDDYVARVEPSPSGGRKMAEFILDRLRNGGASVAASGATATTSAAPKYYSMQERD